MNSGSVDPAEELIVLSREFRDSPELKLFNRINQFRVSIYTFNVNFKELKELIEFMINDPKTQALDDVRNHDVLNRVLDELIRKLHNFAASAFSLVDHTRVFYEKLYTSESFPDYLGHLKKCFHDDPIIQFVDGLRQYCQHYKSPNIGVHNSFTKGDVAPKKIITLPNRDLLEFDSWKPEAKKFLKNAKSDLNLLDIVKSYHEKVTQFQNWFDSRQREIHKKEFQVLEDKNKRILCLQLKRFLKMESLNNKKSQSGEVDIFYGILKSKDYEELNRIPMDSMERRERALKMVQSKISITEEMVEQINQWYAKQI